MPKRVTTINRSRLRRWYRWIHRTRVRSKIRAVTNYVRGRSRLRSRPVPRNLSHPGEVIAAGERARLSFFYFARHTRRFAWRAGENAGSGSINRPQFPTERVSGNLRTPQIKSTTFEVRRSSAAFEVLSPGYQILRARDDERRLQPDCVSSVASSEKGTSANFRDRPGTDIQRARREQSFISMETGQRRSVIRSLEGIPRGVDAL